MNDYQRFLEYLSPIRAPFEIFAVGCSRRRAAAALSYGGEATIALEKRLAVSCWPAEDHGLIQDDKSAHPCTPCRPL
jgi:hypothetical protein